MNKVRVTWQTSDIPSNRGGAFTKVERRTFDGADARTLAEHYVAHVVSPQDPDWYRIEPQNRERGATAVEYAVMLAAIVVVIVLGALALGRNTSQTFSCTAQVIQTRTACDVGGGTTGGGSTGGTTGNGNGNGTGNGHGGGKGH